MEANGDTDTHHKVSLTFSSWALPSADPWLTKNNFLKKPGTFPFKNISFCLQTRLLLHYFHLVSPTLTECINSWAVLFLLATYYTRPSPKLLLGFCHVFFQQNRMFLVTTEQLKNTWCQVIFCFMMQTNLRKILLQDWKWPWIAKLNSSKSSVLLYGTLAIYYVFFSSGT